MKLEKPDQFSPLIRTNVATAEVNPTVPYAEVSTVATERAAMLKLWKTAGYNEVAEKYGQASVSEVTLYRWQKRLNDAGGNIAALNPAPKETTRDIGENLPEILEKLLPRSEYLITVTYPETGREIQVVDTTLLKELATKQIQYKGQAVSNQKILFELLRRHQNDMYITKGQLAMEDYTERPLFYVPKSATEATRVSTIVDDDSHMTLFDIANNVTKANQELLYPTEDGSELSFLEAQVAYTLFHPSQAFAVREGDTLMVKNPDYNHQDKNTVKRVPITTKILRRYGLRQLQKSRAKNTVNASIQDSLAKKCPNLLASGAIKKTDFREITLTPEGEQIEDFSPCTISPSGYVTIHGVDHWIGRPYAGYEVTPFNGTKAIIIAKNGNKQIIRGLFSLTSKDDVSSIYRNDLTGSTNYRANAEKTKLQSISYSKFSGRESGAVLSAQQQQEAEATIAQKVSQLITLAKQADQLVRDELGNVDESFGSIVRKVILSDVERLISSVACAQDAKELYTLLDTYTDEARVFVAVLTKIGSERMSVDPLDHINATHLTEQYREQMRHLIYDNYRREYPGETNKEFRDTVIASFEKALISATSDFCLLKDNGTVVSFNRFDTNVDPKTKRKILYFGSFNADPKYRGVGGFMLERTIQAKLKECDVMQAHCDPQSDISKKYIEDGFVATNTETVAGKFSFEIWRSRDSSEKLVTKNLSIPDLLAYVDKPQQLNESFFVRRVESNDQFYELDEGLGYALTRYFSVNGVTYAAFEIPAADLYNSFTPVPPN